MVFKSSAFMITGRCSFHGTASELESHLATCQYEAMKDYIKHTESRMADLQQMLQQKDQEINFLRSMLGKLSEKVESLEKAVEGLLTILFDCISRLLTEFTSQNVLHNGEWESLLFHWNICLYEMRFSRCVTLGSI